MRKISILAICVCLSLFVGQALANISSSAHDFSSKGWNTAGELCNVCHTPHNADISVSDAPLWNHEVTAFATFTLYDTITLDATDVGQPAGASKLCLSCHDGTVALDNFGGATGGTNFISTGLVGTDLSNDHPISFTYNTALATTDGDLFDPANTTSGLGLNIDDDMLFGVGNDQLECSSCHDVHDKSGVAKLLVKSNGSSALCVTCHNK